MAKKIPTDRAFIVHGDLKVPVAIYFEARRNTRISIGAEVVHLRLSNRLSKAELQDQIAWAEKWLHRRFEKAPALLERFKTIHFKQGDRIRIMHDTFVIHVHNVDKKSSSAQLNGNDIHLTLAHDLSEKSRHKSIQTLLHKILCKRYLTKIQQRVADLNERYFRRPYRSVQIKYIHSKWGSCSTDGEIILSSKLLLCPNWVIDYVIVHELAHLIEHNHGPRFWKQVAQALPNYERAEKWLNEHGSGLEIKPLARLEMPARMMTSIAAPSQLDDKSEFDQPKIEEAKTPRALANEPTPKNENTAIEVEEPSSVPAPTSLSEDSSEETANQKTGNQLTLF